MPLIKSGSREAIGENISEMEDSGRPHAQAVAAALHTADQYGGRKHRLYGGPNYGGAAALPPWMAQGTQAMPQGMPQGMPGGMPNFAPLQSFFQSPQFQQMMQRWQAQRQAPQAPMALPQMPSDGNYSLPVTGTPTPTQPAQVAPQPAGPVQAPTGLPPTPTALAPAGGGAAPVTAQPGQSQPQLAGMKPMGTFAPGGGAAPVGGGAMGGKLWAASGGVMRPPPFHMGEVPEPRHIPEPHMHRQPMYAPGGLIDDEHHQMARHIADALMLAGKYKQNKPKKAEGGTTAAQSARGDDAPSTNDVDTRDIMAGYPQAGRNLAFEHQFGRRPEDVSLGSDVWNFGKHEALPAAAMAAAPLLRAVPKSVVVPALAGLAANFIPGGSSGEAEAQQRSQNNAKAPATPTAETLPKLPGTDITGNLPPDVAADPKLKILLQQYKDARTIADKPLDPTMSGKTRQGAIDSIPGLQQQISERVGELTKSSQPFAQAHPGWNDYWNTIQWLGPAAVGYLAKTTTNLGTRALNSGANKAVNAAEEMLWPKQGWWSKMRGEEPPQPQTSRALYEIMKADEYAKAHPWLTSPAVQKGMDVLGKFGPPFAGAGFGIEASLYRPNYDIANTPEDHPAHREAKEKLKTLWPYLTGAGIGAASGWGGAHIFPTIGPGQNPAAATRALKRFTGLGGEEPPPGGGPNSPSSGGPGSPGLPGGGARPALLDQGVSEAEVLPKPPGGGGGGQPALPEPDGGGKTNLPAVRPTPEPDSSLSSLNPNDAMRRLTPPPARPPRPASIDEPEPKPPEPEPPEATKFKLGKVQLPKGHPSGFGGRWVPHEIINDPVKEAEYLKRFAKEPAKGSGKSKENAKGTTTENPPAKPTDPNDPAYWQDKLDKGQRDGGFVSRALGGAISLARKYAKGGRVVVGPVVGATGGRADKLPVKVPANSFVIPADIVSHLGEGNTDAGMKILAKRFGAAGGRGSAPVDIMISHGEFVVSPEAVMREGHGSFEIGHRKLEQYVIDERQKALHTIASLPGPARD